MTGFCRSVRDHFVLPLQKVRKRSEPLETGMLSDDSPRAPGLLYKPELRSVAERVKYIEKKNHHRGGGNGSSLGPGAPPRGAGSRCSGDFGPAEDLSPRSRKPEGAALPAKGAAAAAGEPAEAAAGGLARGLVIAAQMRAEPGVAAIRAPSLSGWVAE
jgi:hypothetical protein